MKKEFADIWSAALRSGEYEQGKHALTIIRGGKEYDCCLGVACKIADKFGVKMTSYINETKYKRIYTVVVNDIEADMTLPSALADAMGVRALSGEVNTEMNNEVAVHFELTGLNDSDFTFSQIADVIDYFWEEL